MPIYDYICLDCQKRFDLFMTYSEYGKKPVTCPNCRSRNGMTTGWPQRVQGTLSKGFRSPEMKTFALQPPHSTMRSGPSVLTS